MTRGSCLIELLKSSTDWMSLTVMRLRERIEEIEREKSEKQRRTGKMRRGKVISLDELNRARRIFLAQRGNKKAQSETTIEEVQSMKPADRFEDFLSENKIVEFEKKGIEA